jgi:hypothetical protein
MTRAGMFRLYRMLCGTMKATFRIYIIIIIIIIIIQLLYSVEWLDNTEWNGMDV